MSGRCRYPGVLLFVLLAGAPLARPAQAASSAGASSGPSVTPQAYVREKLAIWQQRLKLQDWKITVSMARARDMKPKTLGNIHWDLETKTAAIHVLDPADYHMPFQAMLDDMEFTVVHELIHLTLAPLFSTVPRNEASRRDEERTVNSLADALLGR